MACLRPVKLFKKGKHGKYGYIKVPCGKCTACRNSRAQYQTTLCKLESLDWKYCYFITLTYANEHLPMARIHQNAYFSDSDLTDIRETVVVESLTPRVMEHYNDQFLDELNLDPNQHYV